MTGKHKSIPGQEVRELGHKSDRPDTTAPGVRAACSLPRGAWHPLSLHQPWALICLSRGAFSAASSEYTNLKMAAPGLHDIWFLLAYMSLIPGIQQYPITNCVSLNLNSGEVSGWTRPANGLVSFFVFFFKLEYSWFAVFCFWWGAEWFSYILVCICWFFFIRGYHKMLNIDSSLCCTIGPCWSGLYIVVCVF